MHTYGSIEQALQTQLDERKTKGLIRSLSYSDGIDFCSNDYLGFAACEALKNRPLTEPLPAGATGSRLISGHSTWADKAEQSVAAFHHAEAALIFTSGYAANVGLLSCIASAEDALILDTYCHASLIDGAKLSPATRFKFRHNDLADLEKKLRHPARIKFVVIESLYSMHGDEAPLQEMVTLCQRYDALLLVDEAHATGVYGQKGEGLVCHYQLQDQVYARIHTFGKALGLHGAAVVGSAVLRNYLINYARTFIYTTALPPASYVSIDEAYRLLPAANRPALLQLIHHFQALAKTYKRYVVTTNTSPIQGLVVGDNEKAKALSERLWQKGFFAKAILSPTLPKGQERLRICLHTFNTEAEIDSLFAELDQVAA